MSASNSRTAVVTGGSRGIGRAVATALLGEGWRVHFCSKSQSSVDRALSELSRGPGEAVDGRVVDVRDQDAVDRYVSDVLAASGSIECLVNNAGLGAFGSVETISGDAWRRVIETNLSGAFYFIRAVSGAMIEAGSGWIVNIASLASLNPFAGGSAYNASKFGLLGLSDAAMLDLRHHGVRVTAILPGSVDSDFRPAERRPESQWMLEPEDVARAVLDLVRYPDRALPSRLELRPSQPPRK